MKYVTCLAFLGMIGAQTATAQPAASKKTQPEAAPTAEQTAFFEKSIRPVLVRECYSCHAATAQKIKGGLRLDTKEGTRKGGDTGPAIVPNDCDGSLLLKAIKQTDEDLKMPPKKKLSDEVAADFEKWIKMGAPDPRDASRTTKGVDLANGRKFWAFQPVMKTLPATVKEETWAKSDIDRFLLEDLQAKGLKPVADADPRSLLRRIHFDLTGLPPSPGEIDAFVKAYETDRQAAVAAVVDELLASPRFGEQWGRHWLDVARYAESSGRASNIAYPYAWRYRDYVINSFNADKPYNRFIREQLAGDLLPAKDDKQKAENLIATGFLAIGPKSHNERNRQQFEMDLADEQIDATFTAFQGLTVACARCHDHKFDPIPQKDYYALVGIFTSTETCYGTIRMNQSNHPSALLPLPKDSGAPAGVEPLSAERRTAIEKQIKDVKDEMDKIIASNTQDGRVRLVGLRTRQALMQSQLAAYTSDGTPKLQAMGVRDSRGTDARLLNRGEVNQPGETVRRGFPQVLTTKQPILSRGSSGRLELADWIANKDNPLTARVMANRVWLHLIGRGLVPTPDNFGAAGEPVNHPALLDYLANSFVDNGWSVKKLIRTIVLSRSYQLSSQFDEKNFETDPENVLVWRMPKRRLEAESIRDTMLVLSGRLDTTPAKASPVMARGEGPVALRQRGPFGGMGDTSASDTHRTVYTPIMRDALPEILSLFDFPDPSLISGERATTTVPAQSLFLMNNPFVISQSENLADGLLASSDDDNGKLTRAYELCYSRKPSEKELANAKKFLETYSKRKSRRSSWAALCQALFASAEFSQK